jgi:zinc transporter, ZIP family
VPQLPTVAVVFLVALLTAVATGLGALPFLAGRHPPRRWLGIANALAAGLMVAASFGLLVEGVGLSIPRTALGLFLGVVLIRLCHAVIERHGAPDFGELKGANARKALLIVGVMTLHSFAEGIGVGVAFGGAGGLGEFVSAAIAIHNVPEGLAISLVLVPRGASVLAAAGWSVFSSLPQPVMAVPAYLFVTLFAPVLPVGLGLAAGAMLWMAFAELLPDARAEAPLGSVVLAAVLGGAAMIGFQELVLR